MRGKKLGFTLVELLAAIAIIAALIVVAGVYIGNYIGSARDRADAQTLTVLNDAITRYKTQGGGTSGFTLGAPIGNILSHLQTPINWNGLNHQVMKTGVTYPSASLKATGTGSSYRFYQYNSVTQNPPAAGTPTSDLPYGAGVGYMARASSGAFSVQLNTSTGWAAYQSNLGNLTYAQSHGITITLPAALSYTFWSCAGNGNSTASGTLTLVSCTGSSLTTLNVSGLTSLQSLDCSNNQLTGITNITSLSI